MLQGGGNLRRGLVGGEHDPPPPAPVKPPIWSGSVVTGSKLGGVLDEVVLPATLSSEHTAR
jgi:hypothetical protein